MNLDLPFNPTKALVREILDHCHDFKWTIQGFGMLRTYLQDDIRLHVWDDRYAVPNVSVIHDHPWHFKSLIVAGQLINWKYGEEVNSNIPGRSKLMTKRTIKPGEGLQSLKDEPVYLYRRTHEDVDMNCVSYLEGEWYQQSADEIHHSECVRGTVTLVKRERVGPDLAHVYFDPKVGFVSAEPRAAGFAEIQRICANSLETWFQPEGS